MADSAASLGLPFAMPSNIRSHERKLFAHYFGPYPISLDNAADPHNDYYKRGYLAATGESSKHAAMGGFFRNRPLTRPQIASNHVQVDAGTDITQAKNAGVDGFLCDVMSTGSVTWDRYMAVVTVANASHPGFWVIPMIDTNGSIGGYTADAVADAILAFANKTCSYYLPDGRLVVGSFKAEGKTLAWWQAVFTSLQTRHGIRAAFWPTYLNIGAAVNYVGQPWTYGSGHWGDGSDPQIQEMATNHATAVRARGEKFMFPVAPQNIRIGGSVFDEAKGTAALRKAWERTISNGADAVQFVTWNDYSEGGEVNGSVKSGLCVLDISAYYMIQWKTGAAPAILRDVVYISHRDQLSNATPIGPQTVRAAQWTRNNRSAVVNVVEVLTFLTAPAIVKVTIGGVQQTYTAPAGVNAQTFPLLNGTPPSAVVTRNGAVVTSVTSPADVLARPRKDDPQYFIASSERGIVGQFDPQVKYPEGPYTALPVGIPSLAASTITASPVGIASTPEVFGTVTVFTPVTVTAGGLATNEAVGEPTATIEKTWKDFLVELSALIDKYV